MGDKIIVERGGGGLGCLTIALIVCIILYFTTDIFDKYVNRTDKQTIIHRENTLIIRDGGREYIIDLSGSKPCLK